MALWWQVARAVEPLNNARAGCVAPGRRDAPDALLRRLRGRRRTSGAVFARERARQRALPAATRTWRSTARRRLLVLVPHENELEAESLLAWRQLVQVLTHEIMNSLTPIRSLSQSALALSRGARRRGRPAHALDAIARRADSLAAFVGTYRRVSQWPAPALAPVDVQALFARLEQASRRLDRARRRRRLRDRLAHACACRPTTASWNRRCSH